MRSNLMKFFAIVLAALFLTMAAFSSIAIVYLVDQDLYTQASELDDMDFLETVTYKIAYNFALEQLAVSEGMNPDEIQVLDFMYVPYYIKSKLLQVYPASATPNYTAGVQTYIHTIDGLLYPVVLEYGEEMPNTDALPVYTDIKQMYVNGAWEDFTLLYYHAPPMVVGVTMSSKPSPKVEQAAFIYNLRHYLPVLTIGSAVLALVCLGYLCWAAGKRKGQEAVCPGGLNRLPLDLYTAMVLLALYQCGSILVDWLFPPLYGDYYRMAALASGGLGFVMCLLVVGWIFAFAAQVKAKGFWWRRSVTGWCLLKIVHAIGWCWRSLRSVFQMLPVIWQWLLTAAGMVLLVILTTIPTFLGHSYIRITPFFVPLFLLVIAVCVGIILYGGYCFGTILNAAKEMAQGKLDNKVNTKYLIAAFRDCGENLNSLSSAAMDAARQQMKSERMKTELIANVSHDIKTPLTSIINYVDLLQKPHSEEENAQYMEVLSRQSQRLKKLTEDLIEMSKATTGNISTELTKVDACEAVRQALGEFSDKFDAAGLQVVFRQPEESAMIQADGRLTWRVLSNLLSNAVKYAMPGTRLYADVVQNGDRVLISLKNMSREQLNITADELMERFVRGDASRHTEGSGLGLSIAKGLMEAQNGTLQLLTDGDLFKVTLDFPADNT